MEIRHQRQGVTKSETFVKLKAISGRGNGSGHGPMGAANEALGAGEDKRAGGGIEPGLAVAAEFGSVAGENCLPLARAVQGAKRFSAHISPVAAAQVAEQQP